MPLRSENPILLLTTTIWQGNGALVYVVTLVDALVAGRPKGHQ